MLKGKWALMAILDIKEAYRQVSVLDTGNFWNGQLFVDTALPFGLHSAPMIFNAVTEALAYMIRQKEVKGLITTWTISPLWVIQSRHSVVITSQPPQRVRLLGEG